MKEGFQDFSQYNELEFSRKPSFFETSVCVRVLIGIFFVASLFCFLHYREVKVDIIELGSIAPNYVVAQVDASFYDEESTIMLKQEAIRDIGKVYKLDEKEIAALFQEFDRFLMHSTEWRDQLPHVSFDELNQASEYLEKTLEEARFMDIRALNKLKGMGHNARTYYVITPVSKEDVLTIPSSMLEEIITVSFAGKQVSHEVENFLAVFLEKTPLILKEDPFSQRSLRRWVQSKVPDKFTYISAGSRILDQGERVSARHIAMLQAVKESLNANRNLWEPLTILGSLILTCVLSGIGAAYFYLSYPSVLFSNRKLFLVVIVFIITLSLAKITELILLNSSSHLMEAARYPLFVPFAALVLSCLMSSAVAAFVSAFLTILMMLTLSFESQGFAIMNIVAAFVTILTAGVLHHRKEIFFVCLKAWLCSVLVILSLHFYQNIFWDWNIITDIFSAGVFMLITAVLVVGLLPLLEASFRMMTDVTLIEYMDPNNDILRRLTIEAPGTYQHSIVVGNLAEAAAVAIGANGVFCRVATLYHDIGKMATPQYFTENQECGLNIHQLLTPLESAQVIMAHVSEGVAIARKAGLPEQFIDIIKEHHGTTLVYYFYRKELEKMGGDRNLVKEKDFRYPGPKPRTKESAIIMIADSFEAASRSLDQLSEESLSELANRLVKEKAEDGQLDECLLTFEELAKVKAVLIKTLLAFSHSRIKYPRRELSLEEKIPPIPVEA